MKFHVTLEHDQPDDAKKKPAAKAQAKPTAQPAPTPSKPKKTTSNKNISPPTQANPQGTKTMKSQARQSKKATPTKPAAQANSKKAPAKTTGNPASTKAQTATSTAQKRNPQPGPLLGSRYPVASGQNPPGNPMEQIANRPAGSLLPPTPPKEPPATPTTQAMRQRQSNVLKRKQNQELQGNLPGAPREADAGSGFWPPLVF